MDIDRLLHEHRGQVWKKSIRLGDSDIGVILSGSYAVVQRYTTRDDLVLVRAQIIVANRSGGGEQFSKIVASELFDSEDEAEDWLSHMEPNIPDGVSETTTADVIPAIEAPTPMTIGRKRRRKTMDRLLRRVREATAIIPDNATPVNFTKDESPNVANLEKSKPVLDVILAKETASKVETKIETKIDPVASTKPSVKEVINEMTGVTENLSASAPLNLGYNVAAASQPGIPMPTHVNGNTNRILEAFRHFSPGGNVPVNGA